MIDQLTHENLSQNLKTTFRTTITPEQQVDLELTEVSELRRLPGQEQFSVVFRGPSGFFLGQGIRAFSHEHLGEFELFVVPVRQDAQGFYYEAVFNRLRKD